MSQQIDAVNFAQIDANKWADANDEQNLRMMALRVQLAAMQVLWQGVAAAATPEALTAAYNALKNGPKIVNLVTGVFPGGSRKKRQSKKKKNQRRHNNNQ